MNSGLALCVNLNQKSTRSGPYVSTDVWHFCTCLRKHLKGKKPQISGRGWFAHKGHFGLFHSLVIYCENTENSFFKTQKASLLYTIYLSYTGWKLPVLQKLSEILWQHLEMKVKCSYILPTHLHESYIQVNISVRN